MNRPEPTFKTDWRWQSRLRELESRYGYLAEACPSLAGVDRAIHDEAIVFVHGTMSCGMVSLNDLFGLAADGWSVPGHVYRFEHDTFLPVIDNARELAEWIESKLRVRRRLVLAAHSRGGLVAVKAAAELARNRYPAEVLVRTFGTPFRGTPLVGIGKKAISLLYKLGEEIAAAVPVPVLSPLAKAAIYLNESPTLPAGLMDMHERDGGLAHLQDAARDLALDSWASNYDIESGNPGFGVSAEGVLLGALSGAPHDLVVPMASALHCGTNAQPVLRCSHVHYFRQPAVKTAMLALLRPATPAAAAPAEQTGASAQMAAAQPPSAAPAAVAAAIAAATPPAPFLPPPADKGRYKVKRS